MVKVEPVEEREFPVDKEAIGNIGFNEELSVQVFTPYQGESSRCSVRSVMMCRQVRRCLRSTVPTCCRRNQP